MKKQTDLAAVKHVASALLLTEIVKTKFSPMVVQHPFTNTGIAAIPNGNSVKMLDLLENPEDLSAWRQAVRQKIDSADTPYAVYMLLNAPYALTFLKFAQPYLSRTDLSDILKDAWLMSEYANDNVDVSKSQLAAMFRQSNPAVLMDEEERTQLAALEDPVTVYRGVTTYNAKNIKALSWTLDQERAEWFAHRFGEEGTVYEARIEKKHIFALLDGRNESEIVLDPRFLMDIEPVQTQAQALGMTMQ